MSHQRVHVDLLGFLQLLFAAHLLLLGVEFLLLDPQLPNKIVLVHTSLKKLRLQDIGEIDRKDRIRNETIRRNAKVTPINFSSECI